MNTRLRSTPSTWQPASQSRQNHQHGELLTKATPPLALPHSSHERSHPLVHAQPQSVAGWLAGCGGWAHLQLDLRGVARHVVQQPRHEGARGQQRAEREGVGVAQQPQRKAHKRGARGALERVAAAPLLP